MNESRISIQEAMMRTAEIWAMRSTCCRVKAGAVISVDDHIVSTGYNGVPKGQEHCIDYFLNLWQEDTNHIQESFDEWIKLLDISTKHHHWAVINELHAEMNAIIYAANTGIKISGGEIYTTCSPCLFCAKAIIQAKLSKVYYRNLYDREEGLEALRLLERCQISTIKL